jgi:hypothetical protein
VGTVSKVLAKYMVVMVNSQIWSLGLAMCFIPTVNASCSLQETKTKKYKIHLFIQNSSLTIWSRPLNFYGVGAMFHPRVWIVFTRNKKTSDFAIFDMKNRHFFKFYQDSSTNENSVNRLFRKPNYVMLTLRRQIIVHNVSFI